MLMKSRSRVRCTPDNLPRNADRRRVLQGAMAMAVLFETIPFLRGGFGNVVWFFTYIAGMAVNNSMEGTIYSQILSYSRYPDEVFVGARSAMPVAVDRSPRHTASR